VVSSDPYYAGVDALEKGFAQSVGSYWREDDVGSLAATPSSSVNSSMVRGTSPLCRSPVGDSKPGCFLALLR